MTSYHKFYPCFIFNKIEPMKIILEAICAHKKPSSDFSVFTKKVKISRCLSS